MPRPLHLRPIALILFALSLLTTPVHALLEGSFLYFPSHAANESRLSEWKINGAFYGSRHPAGATFRHARLHSLA